MKSFLSNLSRLDFLKIFNIIIYILILYILNKLRFELIQLISEILVII